MLQKQYVQRLSKLESFDAKVFVGDENTPQHVCDFVLTLAVICNDLRDLLTAQQAILLIRPEDDTISPRFGEFHGLHAHWLRATASLLKALAEVISENRKTMDHPFFRRLIRSLAKPYRSAWQNTVTAALAIAPQGDRFGRMIFFARNKVASHYDPKEIARGYRMTFLEPTSGPPYVSRGDALASTRFYFADASAERYLMYAATANDAKDFFESGWEILPDISHALREIVIHYVNARGYGWRSAAT